MPRSPTRILVTCEHASDALPREAGKLGLPEAVLRSHRGYDVGALDVARELARALRVPLHRGRWSRLFVDLNRSADSSGVIAERVDGRPVPGNELSAAARARRLARYWQPYRDEVEHAAVAAARDGLCIHLSVHSFVERLRGIERPNDVGLLYDPKRPVEVATVLRMKRALERAGLSVRRNFPYFGNTDGLTTYLRNRLPPKHYLGIEVELNQRLARTTAGRSKLSAAVCAAAAALLAAESA